MYNPYQSRDICNSNLKGAAAQLPSPVPYPSSPARAPVTRDRRRRDTWRITRTDVGAGRGHV